MESVIGILEYIGLCLFLGLVVAAIRRWVPLPAEIQTLILAAVVVLLVIVLLNAIGLFNFDRPIPRLR